MPQTGGSNNRLILTVLKSRKFIVHGIFQTGIVEWVAVFYSRGIYNQIGEIKSQLILLTASRTKFSYIISLSFNFFICYTRIIRLLSHRDLKVVMRIK